MRWSKEHYMARFPEYNRTCTECGKPFNAMHLGSRRRVTCSRPCAEAHAKRLQRENTRAYIKTEKYKAYKAQYYEAVKAKRRLARIGDVLSEASDKKGIAA